MHLNIIHESIRITKYRILSKITNVESVAYQPKIGRS